MRSSVFSALLGLLTPLQSQCIRLQTHAFARQFYSTTRRRSARGTYKLNARKHVRLAAAGGTLGASVLFFTDEIKYGYDAAERTGRVLTTLALCINE